MGLLDSFLGATNPLASYVDQNRNLLGAVGAGLGAGVNFGQGLGDAAQLAPKAAAADRSNNATAAWLEKMNPDLANMVRNGAMSPGDAFNAAFKMAYPTPVPLAPGSVLVNPYTGKNIAANGGGSGGFYSTDMRSQAWNTVMRANAPGADPAIKSSPAFQASWAIVTQPTMTPQGIVEPQLPSNWGPSASGQASSAPAAGVPAPAGAPSGPVPLAPVAPGGSPAAAPSAPAVGTSAPTPTSASVSDMPMIAPAANAQLGHGIVPGTQPFNQSQSRTTMLTQSAIPDLKRVIEGFPALMNTKDQLLSKFGDFGRVMQDPAYKQTSDAMTSAMGNILYVASGANLNAGELQRKVQAYMPSIGDDPQTAVNKLDRFANDVMTQANSTKDEATIQWAQQAVQGIKQTEAQVLAGPQSQAPQTVPAGTPIWGPDGKQYVMGPHGTPVPVM